MTTCAMVPPGTATNQPLDWGHIALRKRQGKESLERWLVQELARERELCREASE